MNPTTTKTKRIGKHYFRLTGRDNLYFKGQHIVNFTPLPKKYHSPHSANKLAIATVQSCPLSTTIANTTPQPSSFLQLCYKTMSLLPNNTENGQPKPFSPKLPSYFESNSVGPQTQKPQQVLWGLQEPLRRLQRPY